MAKEDLLLSDYFGILLRRKWVVLLFVLLAVVAGDWWARQAVVRYHSRARFKMQRQMTFTDMFDAFVVGVGDPIANHLHEITSYMVASNAAARLAAPDVPSHSEIQRIRDATSAQRLDRSDIIEVSVFGTSPEESSQRCNAVVAAFVEQHDLALRRNAMDALKSIENSYGALIEGLKQKEAEMLANLGPGLVDGRIEDEIAPLRARLTDLNLHWQSLRLSGNYTDAYSEIVAASNQIVRIEGLLRQTLNTEFERRIQVAEYERYRRLMDEKAGFFALKIEEARIASEKKSEIVHVIEPATPGVAVGAGRLRKTMAGGLLGLMIGVVLAFVVDNLDTSVRTIREIEDIFRLPVLGVIPHFSLQAPLVPIGARGGGLRRLLQRMIPMQSFRLLARVFSGAFKSDSSRKKGGAGAADSRLIVPFVPRSPAAEAYRTLQTNVRLALSRESVNLLMVTSASPEEGKTTTIANLALSFAQAGKRTLLVGANMRRPQMYRTFGLKREGGLSDILTGDLAWRETVKNHTDVALGAGSQTGLATMPGIDNLFYITCGSRTAQPAELLAQPMLDVMLKDWRAEYDMVLVDVPPVIPVPDSLILAEKTGTVALVYQQGVPGREMTQRAIISIQNTGARILGIVLNDLRSYWVDQSEFFHYRTYYGRPE